MAEPEADRCAVDETEEAFDRLVVTCGDAAGILELVETPLDEVSEPIEFADDGHAQLAGFSHRYHRHDIAMLQSFANPVSILATICQQDAGLGQVVVSDQIEAPIACPAFSPAHRHGSGRYVDGQQVRQTYPCDFVMPLSSDIFCLLSSTGSEEFCSL